MWNSPNREKNKFFDQYGKKLNQFGKKPFVDRDRKRDKWWSQIFLAEKRQNTWFSSNETEWQCQIWSIKNKRQPCKNVKKQHCLVVATDVCFKCDCIFCAERNQNIRNDLKYVSRNDEEKSRRKKWNLQRIRGRLKCHLTVKAVNK